MRDQVDYMHTMIA